MPSFSIHLNKHSISAHDNKPHPFIDQISRYRKRKKPTPWRKKKKENQKEFSFFAFKTAPFILPMINHTDRRIVNVIRTICQKQKRIINISIIGEFNSNKYSCLASCDQSIKAALMWNYINSRHRDIIYGTSIVAQDLIKMHSKHAPANAKREKKPQHSPRGYKKSRASFKSYNSKIWNRNGI